MSGGKNGWLKITRENAAFTKRYIRWRRQCHAFAPARTRSIPETPARHKNNIAWHLPDRFAAVAAKKSNENVVTLSIGRSIDRLIVSRVCTHASHRRFGGPGSVHLQLAACLPTIPNPQPCPTSCSRFSCRSGRSADPW